MALSSTVIIRGQECECEFAIKIILNETINEFDKSQGLRKKADIIKLCHLHEQNTRTKLLNELRRNNNPSLLESLKPALTDLSYEIKTI
jgi:hypothetical protein